MPVLCADCRSQHQAAPTQWFNHVWRLYSLAAAGYPFGQDDLSLKEWLAVGEMKSAVEEVKYDAE